MKVTIIPKKKPEIKDIPYNDIPVGMVYTCKYGGNIMLKLKYNEAAALSFANGVDCFCMADITKNESAAKILGKLKEIIVEEL